MIKALTSLFFAVFCSFGIIQAAVAQCPIFPVPKEYRETGESWTLAEDGKLAIVLSANASETERYAAERLHTHLKRRFGRNVAVISENGVVQDLEQVILMGQPATCNGIKRLCEAEQIVLTPESPGMNGFVLRFIKEGNRRIMLVGGSDALGVVFGGDALFDLMSRSGDSVNVRVATVRDWPSIPWRGRPHSVLHHHLVPGAMDAYIRARINFSDIRDNPNVKENYFYPARKASMGLPAGQPLDVTPIQEAIREFHRRGLFVYGTVDCAVPKTKYDAMLRTFGELIDLGVDGIWISLDDTGAGEDPHGLVRTVLDFGKKHGMTGRKIAYTPPNYDYQTIDRPLNHELAKIPGFDEILWFFTRVPCEADLAMTQSMGIKLKPGWWFNLADGGIQGGISHSGGIMVSTRKGKPGYLDMVPMSHGWGKPDYDNIRNADQYTDQVLLWAVCDGWPEEYEVVMFGQWAWNPEKYDWNDQRRAAYRYLYGDEGVAIAFEYDDILAELENQFLLPGIRYTPNLNWPPRLKDVKNRDAVLRQAARLRELAERLTVIAPKESAIDRNRLERGYLEPMRATAELARKMASLDYPEYTFHGLDRDYFALAQEGKTREMRDKVEQVRSLLLPKLEKIKSELGELKAIDEYIAFWQAQADVGSVEKTIAEQLRQKATKWKSFTALPASQLMPYNEEGTEEDLQQLFATWSTPPKGGNRLVEVQPADWQKSTALRGAFLAGSFERCGVSCVGIGLPGNTATAVGDYGQFRTSIPVPKHKGKLIADLFIADTRIDDKYRNVRVLSLSVNGRPVWTQDIALDQRGKEWITIDLTEIAREAETLDFVLSVMEKQAVSHHASLVFLGPLILRETTTE